MAMNTEPYPIAIAAIHTESGHVVNSVSQIRMNHAQLPSTALSALFFYCKLGLSIDSEKNNELMKNGGLVIFPGD